MHHRVGIFHAHSVGTCVVLHDVHDCRIRFGPGPIPRGYHELNGYLVTKMNRALTLCQQVSDRGTARPDKRPLEASHSVVAYEYRKAASVQNPPAKHASNLAESIDAAVART